MQNHSRVFFASFVIIAALEPLLVFLAIPGAMNGDQGPSPFAAFALGVLTPGVVTASWLTLTPGPIGAIVAMFINALVYAGVVTAIVAISRRIRFSK